MVKRKTANTGVEKKPKKAPKEKKLGTGHGRKDSKYLNARTFAEDIETERLDAKFNCNVINGFVTRGHCAMGLCGQEGKKCPHYRAPEEINLLLEYYADKPVPDFMKHLFAIQEPKKKTGARTVKFMPGF